MSTGIIALLLVVVGGHCIVDEWLGDAEAWRRRGLWHRLQDNALYLFNEVL